MLPMNCSCQGQQALAEKRSDAMLPQDMIYLKGDRKICEERAVVFLPMRFLHWYYISGSKEGI